ncbi:MULTISPECIES: restriction endonuclease subunit S [unclassified Psychrobacter]|nr:MULTISPECIES: restriction endonuclease subunit S [unclassified Psychrobacter]
MNVKTSLEMSKDISKPEQLITEHIDIWTSSILTKSTSGRGNSKKYELYGISKLRELILELAVRGKLVPQDTNDEPASVLLEKIAIEKAELIKKGEIRKSKSLPKISKKEQPFDLPLGWEWIHINEIVSLENGDRGKNYPNKSALVDKGIPFINAGQLEGGVVSKKELSYITQDRFDILNGGKFRNGDILFCLRGSLGKCALVSNFGIGAIASSLIIMRPIISRLEHFIMLVLNSTLTKRTISKYNNGTAQPNLSGADLAKFPVPVPPLAEQKRIVAKVDELMLLCDQLEQQTEASIEAHATLVEVLLATLTDSSDADELAQNWARISEHFDSLFTTEQSIEALKQTVLQLAVMGKLVPQDPNDEPASVLLEKIAKEKERLIEEKKIKKEKPLPPISDGEKFFELPKGWEWCQIDSLSLSSEAGWSPKCDPTPKEGDNWGVLKVSAVTWGKYQPDENKALPNYLEPKPQYEVKANDFLISRANTADLVARSVVVPKNTPEKLMMSDKIIRFSFTKDVFSYYINLVNNSSYSREYYAEVAGGTSSSMKNVSRSQVRALKIALPPLAEQHRIVAKVDELMAICDQLKAKLQQSQETQVQLTDALVDKALG